MLIKKGQSLVEVMVALSIVAIVFAGTVTLIVNVVNLELSARSRTVATALAQKKMAETINGMGVSCTLPTVSAGSGNENGFSYTITPTDGFNFDDGIGPNPNTNFVKIDVELTWTDKGVSGDYRLTQVVRK